MGALSNEEKKELAIFSNILQKYGFIYDKNGETKYIGKYFYRYSEKRAWEGLKKNITQKEFLEIKNAFTFFEKRFKKVWDPKELEKRTKILRNLTGNKKWKKLAQHISVLFGGFTPVKEIFVIALLSPLAGEGVTAAGSANIGGDHITYEVPKLKKEGWEYSYSVGILAHEIAHALFSRRIGEKEIARVIKKEDIPSYIKECSMSTISVINEAITESFIPIGYLGQKYMGGDLAPLLLDNSDKGWLGKEKLDYSIVRKYLVWRLYPLAVTYGRQNKTIDEHFIEQAVLSLKNALRNKKTGNR